MPHATHELLSANDALTNVLQSLAQSRKEFQAIGSKLRDTTLREHFLAESARRAYFRADLETALRREGVPETGPGITAASTAARSAPIASPDFEAQPDSGDHALLAAAEQQEDQAVEAYEKAISSPLPQPVLQMLDEQLQHIRTSHEYVRAARNQH